MLANCGLWQVSVVLTMAAVATLPRSEPFAGQLEIAPIQSHPYGQTYSEWAADWWQVALETPESVNPVLVETGENCDQGNQGNVWFLFGTFGGEPIERDCEIPIGAALFFPLINQFSSRFEDEPLTEEELREAAACVEDADLLFEFKGAPVNDLDQFFEESPTFQVQFPDTDALFGLNGILLDLAVDAGFYLFLRPLPPGNYALHWETSSEDCEASQSITYSPTITRGPRV
jgi:hypothetical protein